MNGYWVSTFFFIAVAVDFEFFLKAALEAETNAHTLASRLTHLQQRRREQRLKIMSLAITIERLMREGE
jgi:hypothetical protein